MEKERNRGNGDPGSSSDFDLDSLILNRKEIPGAETYLLITFLFKENNNRNDARTKRRKTTLAGPSPFRRFDPANLDRY